jgi:hypothetical protein
MPTKHAALALAAGLPLAVAASGTVDTTTTAVTTVAAAPTTAAVAPYPPPSGTWPADWTIMVDDTQTTTIAVPPTWTAIDTVPSVNSDGSPRPWIAATTDYAMFLPESSVPDTYSVPGVVYIAASYEADTMAILAQSAYHQQCTAEPVQTFDNGVFSGHIQGFNACGGTATRVVQVAGNPADGVFTAHVLVQLTGAPDDAAILDGVLSSFGKHVPPAAG